MDWRIKRPFLTRITAHLSIILLALATVAFIGAEILEPRARVSAAGNSPATRSFPAMTRFSTPAEPNQAPAPISRPWPHSPNPLAVSRMPILHTIIPQRPRARVITYTSQPGDTLFTIADQFGLSVSTIVWSNQEVFQKAPWLIRTGTELFILPIDGVYHTARTGETAESIAATYGVNPANLYNEWNELRPREQPCEGQRLVIPAGQGKDPGWQAPALYPAPGSDEYSLGTCNGTMVVGPGGHGWFTYPTGRSAVSGWFFHDRRNRAHIGLDYDCELGDPIYAADNGVVTIARRNGTYGIMVEINHGNNFVTRYGHFSSVAVECGQSVYQGDLIGACGNTGWSSGPHLHFEIRQNNKPLDPETYLPRLD